jgi:hypothetical protein
MNHWRTLLEANVDIFLFRAYEAFCGNCHGRLLIQLQVLFSYSWSESYNIGLQFTISLNPQLMPLPSFFTKKKEDVVFMFIFITIDAWSTWQILLGNGVDDVCR